MASPDTDKQSASSRKAVFHKALLEENVDMQAALLAQVLVPDPAPVTMAGRQGVMKAWEEVVRPLNKTPLFSNRGGVSAKMARDFVEKRIADRKEEIERKPDSKKSNNKNTQILDQIITVMDESEEATTKKLNREKSDEKMIQSLQDHALGKQGNDDGESSDDSAQAREHETAHKAKKPRKQVSPCLRASQTASASDPQ